MENLKVILFIFLGLLQSISAQELADINLLDLCQNQFDSNKIEVTSKPTNRFQKIPLKNNDLIVIDSGFCEHFVLKELQFNFEALNNEIKNSSIIQSNSQCDYKLINTNVIDNKKNDHWKIRFYASHSSTTYFNTEVQFKTSRYNLDVKNYVWDERSSRDFFLPSTWDKPGNSPLQVLDEPSNTYTFSIEKNGNEFFLSLFHPKFTQGNDQIVQMKGTIDGANVDKTDYINKPFDGYDKNIGESEIVLNQNTYREYNPEIGYGKRINLLKTKYGSVDYIPSVSGGVMMGGNLSRDVQKGKWFDFDSYQAPYEVQGYGGTIRNRLEVNSKSERFGLFYENRYSLYQMDHQFLDGSESYVLRFSGNSAGFKIMIYNPNKH